jgi:hypothetical protein
MAKRKERPRTKRRQLARDAKALADAKEKLAMLSPGGSSERPITVSSASIVESAAEDLGCARCDGPTRIEEHDAVAGLRRVRARCKHCSALRTVWLQIASRTLS